MSTDIQNQIEHGDIDSPWLRLYWTLPTSLLICAIVFAWFIYSMGHSAPRTPEPVPVDAQLIEIPPPEHPPVRQKTVQKQLVKQSAEPKASPQKELPTSTQTAPAPTVTAPTVPPPVATPEVSAPSSTMTESRGSQAIVRPLPVIPDELRDVAMHEAATARFHVAADGTVSVELIKPTQNPRLNRLLLDTLKQWKFFPAMKDGKTIASVSDIVIRVQVQ